MQITFFLRSGPSVAGGGGRNVTAFTFSARSGRPPQVRGTGTDNLIALEWLHATDPQSDGLVSGA